MKNLIINRATTKAKEVLFSSGLLDEPTGLPIEDIALSRGVSYIQATKIDGAQGRIMINEGETIISYNNQILNDNKRRFVIAHEIGHYELHQNIIKKIHTDNNKSLSELFAKGKHENEANQFAAELLMPSHLFINQVNGRKFNLDLIKDISYFFKTSITSTLIKYKSRGEFPIGIIFCKNKKVEWSSFSEDFYLQYVPKGMFISDTCVAYDFYINKTLPNIPEQISAMDWFANDFKVSNHLATKFYEQCIQIGSNGVLSCIWSD